MRGRAKRTIVTKKPMVPLPDTQNSDASRPFLYAHNIRALPICRKDMLHHSTRISVTTCGTRWSSRGTWSHPTFVPRYPTLAVVRRNIYPALPTVRFWQSGARDLGQGEQACRVSLSWRRSNRKLGIAGAADGGGMRDLVLKWTCLCNLEWLFG